jgi:KaiC/GvpD/RAD55 family RecA-like ATPase
MQSLYEAALQGEKSLYICLEEEPEQLKRHMRENFNWKIDELEKNGLFGFMKLDAMQVAREVEGLILQQNTELESEIQTFAMPFKPDRIFGNISKNLNANGAALLYGECSDSQLGSTAPPIKRP